MNWIIASVLTVGALAWYARKGPLFSGKSRAGQRKAASEEDIAAALASDDPKALLSVLLRTKDPTGRHALFTKIVEVTYPKRGEAHMRETFFETAEQHVAEFPAMCPGLQAMAPTNAPMVVPTFKCLAIAYEQEARYEEALAVCRRAIELGVEDGTKTGFKGRIGRIEKKRERIAQTH